MKFLSLILIILFSYSFVLAEDLTSSNFIIRNPLVDSGGSSASSTNFQDISFTGQVSNGEANSASFIEQSGFAYTPDTLFALSAPTSTIFNSIVVSTSAKNTSSTLSDINIVDSRGTAPGWSITLTSTNLTVISTSSTLAGSNNTVNWSGTYTGVTATSTAATYTAEITTPGVLGIAVFKWTDPNGQETLDVTTGASVSLSNSLLINFGSGNYSLGDKWRLNVDSVGYNGLTVTPGSITVNSGSGSGVTAGSNGSFSGSGVTSNPRTLMSSTSGNGNGDYSQNPILDLNVHANNLKGNFRGTLTITLS